MPKHSKNTAIGHHCSYHEKKKADSGTITQRLGVDSQLPFGYCALSLEPCIDPVVSPSGHMYSKESILEYLLVKTQEIKKLQELYEIQQSKIERENSVLMASEQSNAITLFVKKEDGVIISSSSSSSNGIKRKEVASGGSGNGPVVVVSDELKKKAKLVDETSIEEKRANLKEVCPWIPQFTPAAPEAPIPKEAILQRPASPCSGQPLRIKDLVPVNLVREAGDAGPGSRRMDSNAATVRYLDPVTKYAV